VTGSGDEGHDIGQRLSRDQEVQGSHVQSMIGRPDRIDSFLQSWDERGKRWDSEMILREHHRGSGLRMDE